MDTIKSFFPDLTDNQIQAFEQMKSAYEFWNARINVISRKDMNAFYVHHVLHSLTISKFVQFSKGSRLVDIGSGGGFPGIPLAVIFPETEFYLMDSIRKKTKVIDEVAKELNLKNVKSINSRSEEFKGKYHYMTARAVTRLPEFVKMTKHLLINKSKYENQGLYYLKGGDLTDELKPFNNHEVWDLNTVFSLSFFETKKLVFLPVEKK